MIIKFQAVKSKKNHKNRTLNRTKKSKAIKECVSLGKLRIAITLMQSITQKVCAIIVTTGLVALEKLLLVVIQKDATMQKVNV